MYNKINELIAKHNLVPDQGQFEFAEDIIRECLQMIRLSTLDYTTAEYYSGWLDMRDAIVVELSQHWGIPTGNECTPLEPLSKEFEQILFDNIEKLYQE